MSDELKEYFETHSGTAVLSTADGDGKVNSAMFARPHVLPDGNIAFIMREHLTYASLQVNPHAAYLFRQDGEGYDGLRLHLTLVSENDDQALIDSMCRVRYPGDETVRRILMTFRIDRRLPLAGPA